MKNKFKFLATMLMGILLSVNVWGASPATGDWDLTSSSSDWTASGNETYFTQPYGYKKANGTLVNKNVADFTSCATGGKTITSIKVGFKGLRNGNTASKITISLVDKDGNILTSGSELELTNADAASKTAYVYSTFTTGLTGATGFMMKVTTFGKNVLINGASYEIEYEEASADPVETLYLWEAGVKSSNLKGDYKVGDKYTLPSTTEATCGDKVFVGWSSEEIPTEGSEPSSNFYAPGAEVTLAANNNFYAVFADKEGEGENGWEKVTTVAGFTPGTYVFGYESNEGFIPMRKETDKTTINVNTYLRAGTTAGSSTSTTLTLTASTDVTAYAVTIGAGSVDGTITIHNGTNYIGVGSSSGSIHNEETSEDWKPEISNEVLILKHNTSTTYIFSYNTSNPRFAAYTSSQGKPSFYKWTSNTSYSAYTTTCKACESEVTVTESACENGTFTVSKETVCADDAGGSVTVTCTPDEHYHVSAVTATVGTVTGSGNSYTVSGITAATEITVTFAIDQQITVTWNVNGTATPQILWPGEHVTALPEAPTVMPTCANTFMGWSTSTLVGEGHDAPTDLFNKIEDLPEITADITFNAVFAMAVGGGQDAKYSKLTDVSVLKAGDKIVITGVKNETLYGMKAYVDPANNCLATDNAVTLDVSGNIASLSGACELTLGGSAGAWTLFDGTYYLYAAGTEATGTNYMKGKTTADDACLWTIAYNSTIECNDVISVKNDKTPCLRHNNDGSTNIFSCYKSGNTMGVIALYRKPGTTYSNYVTSCATYTVTWMSNGFEIRKDENVAPGTELTAPTVSAQAACNDHLVGWMPAASTTNPKVKQDTAPAGMVGQQVTVTGNVVYHAVYADVAGE